MAGITQMLCLPGITVSSLSSQNLTLAHLFAITVFTHFMTAILVPLGTGFLSRSFFAHGMQSGGLLQ